MNAQEIEAKNAINPRCFTCGAAATHKTDRITPAGYHGYACDSHAPKRPANLWGSDPGWQYSYVPIAKAALTNGR